MKKVSSFLSNTQASKQARDAFLVLANLENLHKNNVLHELAQALRENSAAILAENARDMAEAQKMLECGELSASACNRVLLNEEKIEQMAQKLRKCSCIARSCRENNSGNPAG